jgi:hypothetical protein
MADVIVMLKHILNTEYYELIKQIVLIDNLSRKLFNEFNVAKKEAIAAEYDLLLIKSPKMAEELKIYYEKKAELAILINQRNSLYLKIDENNKEKRKIQTKQSCLRCYIDLVQNGHIPSEIKSLINENKPITCNSFNSYRNLNFKRKSETPEIIGIPDSVLESVYTTDISRWYDGLDATMKKRLILECNLY